MTMTIANVEMAAAWDGHEGDMWTTHAEHYEASSRRAWQAFLDRGLVSAGDNVLDIGCGTGRPTRDLGRLAAPGRVLGVDLSRQMLERGRARSEAEGLTNVEFVQADAQVHPFEEGAFDVAVSSFGAMFFKDLVGAFGNIGRALRPGGRLAVLSWQELARNEWLQAFRGALAVGRTLGAPPNGAPGPFGLADPDQVRQVLEAAGFVDVELEPIEEPLEFGADAEDAFAFAQTTGIVEGLTHDLDDADTARALEAVREMLVAHDTGHGVLLDSAAWLITARQP
ncbi:MAG TPA: class I SAM-dependent methyltransferase [Acidimicrobiales bacterium]